jgi:RNA polymerase-binding transcription factor
MTTSEIKELRTVLENRQAELGDEIRNREALAIETSPDELDRIQHATARDHAIGSLERNSSRLRQIQGALRRMDLGTFGICITCEEEINRKRLAAVPWATFCIDCQQKDEDRALQESKNEIDLPLEVAN